MARNKEDVEEYEMLEAVPIGSRRADDSDEDEQQDTQDNEYLADLLGVLGTASNVNVTVSHQGERGKFEIIETYPVADLTAETINILRQQYGAGVYRFRAKKKGQSRAVWEKDFGFTDLPHSRKRPGASPPPKNDALGLVLQQMQQQNELFARALAQLQSAPAQDNEEKFLAKLALYKNLFSSDRPQQDPFELFAKALSLVQSVTAKPAEGSNEIDLVRDIVRGMSEYATMPKPTQPARPQIAAPPTLTQSPQLQPQPKQEDSMNPAYYYHYLISQADAGVDPQQLAATIVERVGEEDIIKILDTEDLPGTIIAATPAAEKHRAWFEQLIRALEGLMYEE